MKSYFKILENYPKDFIAIGARLSSCGGAFNGGTPWPSSELSWIFREKIPPAIEVPPWPARGTPREPVLGIWVVQDILGELRDVNGGHHGKPRRWRPRLQGWRTVYIWINMGVVGQCI